MIAGSAAVSFWATPLTFSFSTQRNLRFLELDESAFDDDAAAVAQGWVDYWDRTVRRQGEEAEMVLEVLTWTMSVRESRLHHPILLHRCLVLQ